MCVCFFVYVCMCKLWSALSLFFGEEIAIDKSVSLMLSITHTWWQRGHTTAPSSTGSRAAISWPSSPVPPSSQGHSSWSGQTQQTCRGGKTPWSTQTWSPCHQVQALWTGTENRLFCCDLKDQNNQAIFHFKTMDYFWGIAGPKKQKSSSTWTFSSKLQCYAWLNFNILQKSIHISLEWNDFTVYDAEY